MPRYRGNSAYEEGSWKKRGRMEDPIANSVDQKRKHMLFEYGVLRKIFGYLTLPELMSASRVCREWQNVTRLEFLARSNSPLWFMFHGYNDVTVFQDFVSQVGFKPTVCFTFATGSFRRQEDRVFEEIQQVLARLGCEFLSITALDLIRGTYFKNFILVESWYPVEYCLFFPKLPGVHIVPFRVTISSCRKLGEREGSGIPEPLLKMGRMPIKCLLLFCSKSTLYAARLAVLLQKRQEEGIAIGGVYVSRFDLNGNDELVGGVAIYGDSVEASSLVFHDSAGSNDKVIDDQMSRFHNRVYNGRHDLGFLFCCHGRCYKPNDQFGQRLEIAKDCSKEAAAYRRHFNTPNFIGIVGCGEVGVTCLPVTEETEPVTLHVNRLRLAHTVVAVHIAFDVPVALRRKQQTQSVLFSGLE